MPLITNPAQIQEVKDWINIWRGNESVVFTAENHVLGFSFKAEDLLTLLGKNTGLRFHLAKKSMDMINKDFCMIATATSNQNVLPSSPDDYDDLFASVCENESSLSLTNDFGFLRTNVANSKNKIELGNRDVGPLPEDIAGDWIVDYQDEPFYKGDNYNLRHLATDNTTFCKLQAVCFENDKAAHENILTTFLGNKEDIYIILAKVSVIDDNRVDTNLRKQALRNRDLTTFIMADSNKISKVLTSSFVIEFGTSCPPSCGGTCC